jgi:membrane associated rhomboid family serine protease
MNQASVGFHCPECVSKGGQKVRTMSSLQPTPIVTYAMISINVAVFVIGIAMGSDVSQNNGDLMFDGALFAPNIDRLGEWWRVFTAGFLHASLFHLALNMFALYVLGKMVEPALGSVSYAALYMCSIVAGSFGALLLDPNALTVGASGAVFGLMGAIVMIQRRVGLSIWDTGIGALIGINLLISVTVANISLGGHLGGLVGGLAAGWVLTDGRKFLKAKWLPELAVVGMTAMWFFGCLAIAGRTDVIGVLG